MSSDVSCRASRAPSVVVGSVYRNMAAQLASAAERLQVHSQNMSEWLWKEAHNNWTVTIRHPLWYFLCIFMDLVVQAV